MHLRGAANAHYLAHRRRFETGRAGDQRDLGTAPRCLGGDLETHTTTRSVPDVADRIDILVGRPRRHQHTLPAQRSLRTQDRLGRRHDLVWFRQPALADPATRQVALARVDESDAPRGERVEVFAHGLVLEHLCVHRRRQEHRCARRRIERGEEIVRDPVGELADDIGRRRRDEQEIDRGREGDMFDVGVGARLELIGNDPPARDRFERDGADKPRRRVRHHGHDVVSALLQPARDFNRLIRPDSPGHAERNKHMVIG